MLETTSLVCAEGANRDLVRMTKKGFYSDSVIHEDTEGPTNKQLRRRPATQTQGILNFAIAVGFFPQHVLAAPMHQPSRVHPQFLTCALHV